MVEDNKAAISQATWHDFNAVRQLEKVCFPVDAWPFWDVIGVLALPNVIRLKAVLDDQLVGFVAVDIRTRQNLAWIATIGVLPSYRRLGIATDMLAACENQLSVPYLRLSVRASNKAALQLYDKLGYEKIDRWPRYYRGSEDGIVMQKRL